MKSWALMARRGEVLLLSGAVVSWLVAWGLAAYRPTDGWPNVLGTSGVDWEGRYLLPQHRAKTVGGDVFVDLINHLGNTDVALAPVWVRQLGPEDQWLFTTYPYPGEVSQETLTVFGMGGKKWERFELPYWAPSVPAGATEHHIKMTAYGWPMRCLGGQKRTYRAVDSTGKSIYTEVTRGLWTSVRGWTNGRVRELPVLVLWPGMVVNAVFWGGLIVGPLMVARIGRAALRRRRNACGACGYAREGLAPSAACPECGADRVRVRSA